MGSGPDPHFLICTLGWFDSQKQFVPFIMVPRGTRPSAAPTGKPSVEQTDVRNQIDLKPPPIWQRAAAAPGELISQKLDGTVLDTIVMRLDDPDVSRCRSTRPIVSPQSPFAIRC